jgi:T5SS/PEP-CTERM-associated repeat protein
MKEAQSHPCYVLACFLSRLCKPVVVSLICGLTIAFMSPSFAYAQTLLWSNPQGGLFSNGSNWNPAGPPNSQQNAAFAIAVGNPNPMAITYAVNFNQSHTNNWVGVSTGHVTLNLFDSNNLHTYSLSNGVQITANSTIAPESSMTIRRGTLQSNGEVIISGTRGPAALHLREGATMNVTRHLFLGFHTGSVDTSLTVTEGSSLVSQQGRIGYVQGSNSTATVSGAGSRWEHIEAMAVGEWGNGTLNIQNGGLVTGSHMHVGVFAPVVGTVNISGAGSRWESNGWFTAGWHGTGIFNVSNGGSMSNVGPAFIARDVGSNGTVNLSGATSRWDSQSVIWVGAYGTGLMNVNDASTVTSLEGSVGHHATAIGTANVIGNNSTWNVQQTLYVGFEGTGTLNVRNGGQVTAINGYVGGVNGSRGTVNITGSGATMTLDNLFIGGINSQSGAPGVVNVGPGGRLIVNNVLKVWNSGRLNLNGGQLIVPTYEVNGTLSGSGTLNGKIICFGNLSPDEPDLGLTGKIKVGNANGGSSGGGTDGELVIKGTSTVSIQVGGTSGPGDGLDPFDIVDGLGESVSYTHLTLPTKA